MGFSEFAALAAILSLGTRPGGEPSLISQCAGYAGSELRHGRGIVSAELITETNPVAAEKAAEGVPGINVAINRELHRPGRCTIGVRCAPRGAGAISIHGRQNNIGTLPRKQIGPISVQPVRVIRVIWYLPPRKHRQESGVAYEPRSMPGISELESKFNGIALFDRLDFYRYRSDYRTIAFDRYPYLQHGDDGQNKGETLDPSGEARHGFRVVRQPQPVPDPSHPLAHAPKGADKDVRAVLGPLFWPLVYAMGLFSLLVAFICSPPRHSDPPWITALSVTSWAVLAGTVAIVIFA